jgi:hypothetical protein
MAPKVGAVESSPQTQHRTILENGYILNNMWYLPIYNGTRFRGETQDVNFVEIGFTG